MIDAWEMVGRLLTDNAFETAVFGGVYSGPYPMNTCNRVQIPQKDYDTLQAAARTKMQGPLSLMALGEVLVAMRVPNFRNALDGLARAITATGVNTAGRDPVFYQALGASMVDMRLLAQIPNNFQNFGFNLGGAQPDATRIVTDNGVTTAAKAFCGTCWARGCNLKTILWPEHVHPVEDPMTLKF
jgi:hypothetical protein